MAGTQAALNVPARVVREAVLHAEELAALRAIAPLAGVLPALVALAKAPLVTKAGLPRGRRLVTLRQSALLPEQGPCCPGVPRPSVLPSDHGVGCAAEEA